MMMWYDKLAFAGIVIAFVGSMMFLTGFGYMLGARREAMASYRAAIHQAHEELRSR